MKLKKLSDAQQLVYEYNNPINMFDDEIFFEWLKDFSDKYPNFSDSHIFYTSEINLSDKSKNETSLSTFDMSQIFKLEDLYISLNEFCLKNNVRPNESIYGYYYYFKFDKIPFQIGVDLKNIDTKKYWKEDDNSSNSIVYWIQRLDQFEYSLDDLKFLNLNRIIKINSNIKKGTKEKRIKNFVKRIIR